MNAPQSGGIGEFDDLRPRRLVVAEDQHVASDILVRRKLVRGDIVEARDDGHALAQRVLRAHCGAARSEEHTSELQSLMRISYAVFCLKTKKTHKCKYR